MYKIYINENTLSLADTADINSSENSKTVLIAPYTGKTKMLLSYLDMLEKTNRFEKIVIHSKDLKKLLKDFESLFTVIKAAGGVVNDGDDNILFIHRRGFWDLPKGKIDKGEKKKAAAVREVEEETGIKDIVIGSRILTTRHSFKRQGKRAIKKTYWYEMEAPNQLLIPQAEEDIDKAEWVNLDKVPALEGPIFKNILNVIEAYKASRLLTL